MNKRKYNDIMSDVDLIIRGIDVKMDSLFDEVIPKCDYDVMSDKEKDLYFKKLMLVTELMYKPEYQLLFTNKDTAKQRIQRVFTFISNQDMAFDVLEMVCYATFTMLYISMRKLDGPEIVEITKLLQENIEKISDGTNRDYLNILFAIVVEKMRYLYNSINKSDYQWDRLEEIKYCENVNRMINEAKDTYSQGIIVTLMTMISVIEEFSKNQSTENIRVLRKECFDKNMELMDHLFECSEDDRSDFFISEYDYMKYIPHIKFVRGGYDKLTLEYILKSEPKPKKGHWGVPTKEILEKEEKEYLEKWDLWEESAYKNIFLLPYEIRGIKEKGGLIKLFMYLITEKQELEDTKNSIVSDFAHSYGNYEIDTVYNIAKALNENPSKEVLDKCRKKLLLEYYNRQLLTKEIKMLRLEHKDSFEELEKTIRNSILLGDQGITISEIINEALKRIILRILLSGRDYRIEDITNKYKAIGVDTSRLLPKYENDIIKEDNNCINWANNVLNKISVNISDEWKMFSFKRNSEGNVFLISLLMELLLNMYTYADFNNDMKLNLFTETYLGEKYYVIRTENVIDKSIPSNGQEGLSSRNRILSKINFGKEYRFKDSIRKEYINDETECVVTAKFKSELFGDKRI